VVSDTPPHPQDLLETSGYTGFAALYGDHVTATEPGAEWDQLLRAHLDGRRERPVWGTGEIDYHSRLQPGNRIHDILTVFLVRERTRAAVLEALRRGRVYAVRGGDEQLVLRRFEVDTGLGAGVAGEEVASSGRAAVRVLVEKANGSAEPVEVRLVRDGKVAAQVEGAAPLELEHAETDLHPGDRTYYRLLARSRTALLTSNPIFVRDVGASP
jgi:hypothetical protein